MSSLNPRYKKSLWVFRKEDDTIAWYNGRWLDRTERQKVIDDLEETKRLFDEQFPDVDDIPADLIGEYYDLVTELERLNRIHRAEVDLLYFTYEYFGEDLNPGNDGNLIPEYGDASPHVINYAPDFHKEICDIMNEVSHVNRNAKVAVAAPRSHAKSSYLSKAYPIHEVVYRLRRYIIIISETPKVATANMEWISNQLKHNAKLRRDFGELLSPKDQANIKDNSEEFIAWHEDENGVKRQVALVQAASTGQALRGRNWNGLRPDLIICDDLEDAKTNAATPEQRAKLRDWFSQVVIPLGDPKGEKTAFVLMGTTVHYDSLLMDILYRRSDFKTKVYRALIEEPKNMELWEECRKIYVNRENPNRAEDAWAFYEANREAMDEGARVLWPEVQPLWKLMTWKWDNGSKAFNTEYQNNPIDEESMIFNPETFTYWEGITPDEFRNVRDYEISIGVDLAMGKERGDYQSIAVVARHKATDTFYVVDSYGDRITPDKFIQVCVNKIIMWQPEVVGVESVAAQEFFADMLKQALVAAGYPAYTRLKKIYHRSRKELRIEAMLPDIESGRIRFSRNHTLLLEQFERYGTGEHDDCIDSLEMAISVLKKRKRRVVDKPSIFY